MYLDPTAAAADAHRTQMRDDASRSRLAALAACCQPSALARHARALLAWARSGQLGAGYTGPRHPQPGVRRPASGATPTSSPAARDRNPSGCRGHG